MTDHQLDTGDGQHSKVGPSGIADILLCPGRVKLQCGRKDKTSFAAAEGTCAHECGERILRGLKPYSIGQTLVYDGHEITVTAEMMEAVQVYVDHIEDLRTVPGDAEESVELSSSLGWMGLPEVYGTADYSRSYPFQTLYIVDYKHGQGVLVDAENNPQLMAYALIAGQDMIPTYENISMCIVQPRGKYGDTVKVWETTPDVLLDWSENTLKPAVKLALSDDAPLAPGEKQCKWCRAKDICPALATKALQVAQEDFSDFADIRPDEMVESVPIEKVAQVYERLPLLKSFIKAVEGRVFSELSAGCKVPGYKLVSGRKTRCWADQSKAKKVLRKNGIDPYENQFLSPAKAEKALGKQKGEIKSLIEVKEGSPAIVPESDKRAALNMAADDFKDLAR